MDCRAHGPGRVHPQQLVHGHRGFALLQRRLLARGRLRECRLPPLRIRLQAGIEYVEYFVAFTKTLEQCKIIELGG